MRYTLKQIRYLEAAARQRSITAAANQFNISPSSVAAAIDNIEAELGQALFSRHPSKGIVPTRFGRRFLDNVRKLLASHEKFENALPGISKKIDGSIRLGCFTPVAPIILPLVLKLVAENHPMLSVQIIEGDALKMLELMHDGRIDLALTTTLEAADQFDFQNLFMAPPHVVLSASHPLAGRANLTLEELADEPLILLNLNQTKAYMLGLFEERDLKPKIAYYSRSSEMVRSLVAAGFGFAIYNVKPRVKQTYTVGDLVRIPLSSNHRVPAFGILHHRHARLSPLAKAITEACEQLRLQGAFKDFVVEPVD
jgi:DNA-binding transcriptional LysR family regulator